jgi:hypothetical protein
MPTLTEFITEKGGPVAAAKALKIPYRTLCRWRTRESKPRGLYAQKLARKGIKL